MKSSVLFSLLIIVGTTSFSKKKNTQQKPAKQYFPAAHNWQHKTPQEAGFDTVKLQKAIQFAIEKENKQPRSMEISQAMSFGKEPFGESIGPFADRGEPTGLIIHKGYIVAEWGNPHRVDMTHSVSKSFLSTVVGLAFDKGLIRSVDDPVSKYIGHVQVYEPTIQNRPAEDIGKPQLLSPFSSEHNIKLSWDVMLRQTSDWEGTLWGKPDWADRPDASTANWLSRKRNNPGSVFEYNDVRVNALALAATMLWRKPLPQF
jgi:CubicO group peptidase (beta-lactamase class C family)